MSKVLAHPTAERAAKARDQGRTLAPALGFKALGSGDEPGTFEAIVAVFGNVDSHGDVIRLGAFEKTLVDDGLPPIVWTHDWYTPPIGASLDVKELDLDALRDAGYSLDDDGIEGGLYAKGRLLVADDEEHAIARQVWAAMKATGGDGRPPLREWSFGYRTRKSQWIEVDPDTLPPELAWTGGELRELLELRLDELGPTLKGSNPVTETVAVKSAVKTLELRGVITSDEAKTMLREVGDTPAPNAATEPAKRQIEATEEVRARIAELAVAAPPTTL